MHPIEAMKVALAVLAVPFLVVVAGCTSIVWFGDSKPSAVTHPDPPANAKETPP